MSYDYETSLPAYQEAPDRKDYCRQVVLLTIRKLEPCNDRQIAETLQWPINRVTPRRGELVDRGEVISAGKYLDPLTKRHVNHWKEAKKWVQLTLL